MLTAQIAIPIIPLSHSQTQQFALFAYLHIPTFTAANSYTAQVCDASKAS
jgi:hypothetical protein